LSVPPSFRGRARPLDSLRTGGISNFYWQYFQTPGIAEAEFERDFGLTMKTLLGRGFSEGPSYLFIEPGKGFLGDVRPERPLPVWLNEADLGIFTEAYQKVRLPWRAQLVPQHQRQLGTDRAVAGHANPSTLAVHRGIEGLGYHGPDRRQARQRARARIAKPEAETHHRRRRSLDPVGTAR
jgi:hypothetical protein